MLFRLVLFRVIIDSPQTTEDPIIPKLKPVTTSSIAVQIKQIVEKHTTVGVYYNNKYKDSRTLKFQVPMAVGPDTIKKINAGLKKANIAINSIEAKQCSFFIRRAKHIFIKIPL